MLEDLTERGEAEVLEQALQLRLGRAQVGVVSEPWLPVERDPRVMRIQLPRVEVEDHRTASPFGGAEVRARHGVGIETEVRSSGDGEVHAQDTADGDRQLVDHPRSRL